MRNTNYKNFIKRLLLVFSASLIPAGVLTYLINIINPYSVPYAFYIVLFFGIVGLIIRLFKNYILNYKRE